MSEVKKAQKMIAQNKKAWHDYFVEEKYEKKTFFNYF